MAAEGVTLGVVCIHECRSGCSCGFLLVDGWTGGWVDIRSRIIAMSANQKMGELNCFLFRECRLRDTLERNCPTPA